MPLDKDRGELIDELGPHDAIAPIHKWFEAGLVQDAALQAAEAYAQAGAILPVTFREDDILIQEYHEQRKVVFLFQRMVGGQELYYQYTYDLPSTVVADLALTGKWPSLHNTEHAARRPTRN